MMKNILDVMNLFGPTFAGPTWAAWRAFLAAIFGLGMDKAGASLVRRCTGRPMLPSAVAREAWMVVGRRGGKSRIAALLAVFVACFRRHMPIRHLKSSGKATTPQSNVPPGVLIVVIGLVSY